VAVAALLSPSRRRPLRGAAWGVGSASAVAVVVAVAVVAGVVAGVSAATAAAAAVSVLVGTPPPFFPHSSFPSPRYRPRAPVRPCVATPSWGRPGRGGAPLSLWGAACCSFTCRPAAVRWPRARPPGRPPSSRRQAPARPPGCFRVHRRPVGSPPLRAAAVWQSQVAVGRAIAALFTCRGHISPPGVLEGRAKRGAPRTFLTWIIVVFWTGCGPRRLRPVSVYGGGAGSHPHHERPRASWA
jgi:hypothetical protein